MKPYIAIFILIICCCSCSSKNKIESEDDAFSLLNRIKSDRKEKILSYLSSLHEQARSVHKDKLMLNFFRLKNHYYQLKKDGAVIPGEVEEALASSEIDILYQHIEHYFLFYDILMLNADGTVFHKVLKQPKVDKTDSDELLNIEMLSEQLRLKPTESFVDFQHYSALNGPYSFFMEPVHDNGSVVGWFAFRLSINRLNNLLCVDESLGKTGEVLLVNRSEYMLNNSRFNVKSTILKQKLPAENVLYKFDKRLGNKIVVDYRNKRVLTSFEVFSFLGIDWLITAKMDEDEVVTEMYRNNPSAFDLSAKKNTCFKMIEHVDSIEFSKKVVDVHMDEFRRADSSSFLYTKSVYTCTAMLVTCPGRFAYLAHISPSDRVYGQDGTDLVNQIFKQIDDKELVKSEKGKLKCYVISPSYKAVDEIISSLLDNGLLLPQIKLNIKPDALFADVAYDFDLDEITVYWKQNKEDKGFFKYQENGELLLGKNQLAHFECKK